MRNQKGLTVIELLIVVLFIGIVTALAIPSLQRAYELDSNTKQFFITFGVAITPPLDDDQRHILQPLVADTLLSLKQRYDEAKAAGYNDSGKDPAQAQRNLKNLRDARARYERALELNRYFKFITPEEALKVFGG